MKGIVSFPNVFISSGASINRQPLEPPLRECAQSKTNLKIQQLRNIRRSTVFVWIFECTLLLQVEFKESYSAPMIADLTYDS